MKIVFYIDMFCKSGGESRHLLGESECGFLVPKNDPNELAMEINTFLMIKKNARCVPNLQSKNLKIWIEKKAQKERIDYLLKTANN